MVVLLLVLLPFDIWYLYLNVNLSLSHNVKLGQEFYLLHIIQTSSEATQLSL
jgi:hypothetical protein